MNYLLIYKEGGIAVNFTKAIAIFLVLLLAFQGICLASGSQAADKKLTRDTANGKIGGVCAGIAEYFGWDVTLVRLVWAFFGLAGGTGVLFYLAAWVIMPEK